MIDDNYKRFIDILESVESTTPIDQIRWIVDVDVSPISL